MNKQKWPRTHLNRNNLFYSVDCKLSISKLKNILGSHLKVDLQINEKMPQKSHWSKMAWKNGLNQASTDGLSSICPPVHLRSHFYISYDPSSESVREVDGLSSSAVSSRPSWTKNHGLSSEFVHEMDGPSSSGHPPPSIYEQFYLPSSESVHFKMIILVFLVDGLRWTVRDQKFVHSSTLKFSGWFSVRIRPWGKRFVPEFWSIWFSIWTDGQANGPQMVIFVRGGLV